VKSNLKKKWKATVGRICRKGRFKPGMKSEGVMGDESIDVKNVQIKNKKTLKA